MNIREIAVLRTKLREVNIEYSTLVRSRRMGASRLARLAELTAERRELMAQIAAIKKVAGAKHQRGQGEDVIVQTGDLMPSIP